MNETLVRIITGAGLLVLVISGTLLGAKVFAFVFGAVALLCFVEYFNVTLSDNQKTPFNTLRKVFGVALGLVPFLWMAFYLFVQAGYYNNPLTLTLAIIPFFLLMVFELFANAPDPIKNLAYTGFGVLYIGLPFMMMLYLQNLYNPQLILGIIMLVFMYDSMAYVFGKWKGKTPLFPRISPKKTWEGAIGGSVFAFLLAAAYPLFFFQNGPYLWDWLIVAVLIVVLLLLAT